MPRRSREVVGGAGVARAGRHPRFYRDTLLALNDGGVSYLVGGAFAFAQYTGIDRDTKDFDVFLRRGDLVLALEVLRRMGCRIEEPPPLWLAKAWRGGNYIDLIYGAGNGLTVVDELWFSHARPAEVFGVPVRLCPPEEILWSKAFLQERERYDGADVIHLLHDCGGDLDWSRLLERFGPQWRVLLAHLVVFSFVYPAERHRLPRWVLEDLSAQLVEGGWDDDPTLKGVCFGTLISRGQYAPDITTRGYRDVRVLLGLRNVGE